MGEVENVIKSIEAKMEVCKNKFNENEQVIAKILEQSKELQQQYDNADQRREQLRGEYTGYVNLLQELKVNIPIEVKNSKEDKKEEKEVKETEPKKESVLSEEEVAKVKEITKTKTPKKTTTKKVEPELPDYLKG